MAKLVPGLPALRRAGTPMKTRQTLVLNHALDGMDSKLTNARWAAIGNWSADSALRGINDLLARGVLDGGEAEYGVCVGKIGL